MYYSPWVFVNLGAIFGIVETRIKDSLGSPEQLCVASSEKLKLKVKIESTLF